MMTAWFGFMVRSLIGHKREKGGGDNSPARKGKNMKIKITFDGSIAIQDIKAVKAYAREQRAALEEIVRESIKAVEEVLDISFWQEITEAEATYYNDYKRPVIAFRGKAFDRKQPGEDQWLFVEAFKCLDEEGCGANIYRKELRTRY